MSCNYTAVFFILQRCFSGSPLKSWHSCPPMRKTAGIWFWFLWILKLHDCCQLSGHKLGSSSAVSLTLMDPPVFPLFSLLLLVDDQNEPFIWDVALIFDGKSLKSFVWISEAGLYIISCNDSSEMNLTPALCEKWFGLWSCLCLLCFI